MALGICGQNDRTKNKMKQMDRMPKDCLGRIIKIGDYVCYSVSQRHSSDIRIGLVLDSGIKNDNFFVQLNVTDGPREAADQVPETFKDWNNTPYTRNMPRYKEGTDWKSASIRKTTVSGNGIEQTCFMGKMVLISIENLPRELIELLKVDDAPKRKKKVVVTPKEPTEDIGDELDRMIGNI